MYRYKLFALLTVLEIGSTVFCARAKIIHLLLANSFLAIGISVKAVGFCDLAWFLYKTSDKMK